MIKKLLLIVMLVPFLLVMGCELLGLTEEDIEYGTPSPALIASFDAVESVIGVGMEAASAEAMGADPDVNGGNFTWSDTGIAVTGSVSASEGASTVTMSIVLAITFTDFTVVGSDISITGSFNINMSMEFQTVEPYGQISGSMSGTGSLSVTGSDISTIEFDINSDMITDVTTGDIIIDGVYYHAADFMEEDI